MNSHNRCINRVTLASLLILVATLFSAPSMATGPRVTPTLFASDADKVFAADLVPFVSSDIEGGGLDIEVVNAVFAAAKIENAVTTLPLQKMVKYYLQQENAVAVMGHYLDFEPQQQKNLIFVPISAAAKHYFYYRPAYPDGLKWDGKLSSLKGRTYGANRGEDTAAFKRAGVAFKSASPRSLLKMLINGQVDFVGISDLTMEWLIDNHFPNEKGSIVAMSPAAGALPGFIIFNKKHPQGAVLAERFNKALTALTTNGTYAKIVERYLGEGEETSDYMKRREALRKKYRDK